MKIFRTIIASMFSVLFFFVLLGMTLLLFVSNAFNKEYYKEVLKDVNLEEVKLNEIGIDNFNEELGSEASVNDVLVKGLKEFNINENDAKKIINNNEVKEVVGSLLSDAVIYLTNKENLPQISMEDVEKLKNVDELKDVIGNIPNDEMEKLVGEVNQMIKNYLKEGNNE
ncbi:MAG: hypothetical protein IJZ36_04955 [Bacilli bacterium]|nr:hypothetical protein [Bacilli bacterium]